MFELRRPCPKCPFRLDVPGYLRRERAAEIARAIAGGGTFMCHATVDYDVPEDEDGEGCLVPASAQFCAGALLVMERAELPSQIVRIAERTGDYRSDLMDREAPVHESLLAFVEHHGEDGGADDVEGEQECCSVCDYGCEWPAGLLVDGHVVPAEREGETHVCEGCGDWVCDNCSDGQGVCSRCREDGV